MSASAVLQIVLQGGALAQPPQQQHAQPVAGHHLAQTHGQGVEAVGRPEGGGGARLLIGQHQPDEDGVGQHRRQGRQPHFFAPGGQQGGQQRGGGADHDVQHPVGAEQVGDQAAHAQTPRRLRQEEGQDAQRLGKAALDGAVGDAENGAEIAEDGVCGGGQRRQCQLSGAKLHWFSSCVSTYQSSEAVKPAAVMAFSMMLLSSQGWPLPSLAVTCTAVSPRTVTSST